MLHACVERFDVMGERENILGWNGEVNKAIEFIFIFHSKSMAYAVYRLLS
jgi:hypothetical protein